MLACIGFYGTKFTHVIFHAFTESIKLHQIYVCPVANDSLKYIYSIIIQFIVFSTKNEGWFRSSYMHTYVVGCV